MDRMGDGESEQLLVASDLARKLRTTPAGVYQLRHRGLAPPAIKVGRRLLWRATDVEAWLNRHVEKSA